VLEVFIVALKLPVVGALIDCIDWFMNILWWFLQALSSLPTYYVSSDPIMWLPVCVAVLLVFILRGLNFYLLPLLLLIIVISYPSQPLKNGDFNIYVLDVGQGQSQLIKTANHYLLYDVGGKYGENFSATKFAVWPYLKHQGIHALDGLVISHDDRDHTGDYLWLQSQLGVKKVWAGQPKLSNELECSGYSSWQWDGVLFDFAPQVKALRDNDESCVLRISSHSGSALIVGDIEKKAENQLHAWWKKTDLLVAPHHGSNTSSTEAFINRVDPSYVVFSAGKNNHFGHPHHKVEARYKALSVKRFETSQTGHIRFEFRAGHSPEPAALYRQQSLRFWLSS
jgi:competence protein ComEC